MLSSLQLHDTPGHAQDQERSIKGDGVVMVKRCGRGGGKSGEGTLHQLTSRSSDRLIYILRPGGSLSRAMEACSFKSSACWPWCVAAVEKAGFDDATARLGDISSGVMRRGAGPSRAMPRTFKADRRQTFTTSPCKLFKTF